MNNNCCYSFLGFHTFKKKKNTKKIIKMKSKRKAIEKGDRMAFSGSMKSQRKAIEKGGCKTEKNHLQQPLHQKQSIPVEKKMQKKSRNQRSRRKAETERSNIGQSSSSPPIASEPGKSLLLSFAL